MNRSRLICAALLVLLLSACHRDLPPIVAGSLRSPTPDRQWTERDLTQQQLQSLSTWLAQANLDWGACISPAAGFTRTLSLKHADGSTSWISLYESGSSHPSLLINHQGGTDKSFVETGCAIRVLSQGDLDAIRAILAAPK